MEWQFRVLQKDQGNLRSATTATDNERAKVEEELHNLQQEHRDLTKAAHESQQQLGNFRGTTSLWQKEHARLAVQMEEDRQKLLEHARESDEGEDRETRCKHGYCSEMKELYKEHAGWLRKLEISRLQTLLTPETVTVLCHMWGEKEAATIEKQGEMENGEAGHGLEASMKLWHQASGRFSQEAVANKQLSQTIEAFRHKVLSSNSLSELQILDEEQAWSGTNCSPAIGIDPSSFENQSSVHGGAPHEAHMADFYDTLENENEWSVVVKESGRQSPYQRSLTSSSSSQEQQQCPMS